MTSIVFFILISPFLILAPDASAAEPIDRQPYRIRVYLSADLDSRIDAKARASLVAEWRALIDRLVGAPWEVTVEEDEGGGALAAAPVDALEPEQVGAFAEGADTVWIIRIGRAGAGLALSGRAWDSRTQRLGPVQRRAAPIVADLPRTLMRFALDLFSPSAEVGAEEGGGVSLTVRGASLEASSPVGRVVTEGTVFEPFRIVELPEGQVRILAIPYTYLRVEGLSGPVARCAIVSALRDPLTRRFARKNTLVAVGTKPAANPTQLRFVTRTDKAPASGYVLTMRTVPEGPPHAVGTTDREGRIVLAPEAADGLVILRLLAGDIEPMVELPVMPGATDQERTIPIDPKPLTVTLETQLDSLRDEVVDLIALRARLETRIKARAEGEDWAGVEAALNEFTRLTPRATLADRLTRLKDRAAQQQDQTKQAVLTKTAQARLAEVQNLIDRYLSDEVFQTFSQDLAQVKSGAAPKKAGKK